jgi:hypothetical protein
MLASGRAQSTSTSGGLTSTNELNTIGTNSENSAIGGGRRNHIGTSSWGSFIGGGELNSIGDGSIDAAIVGGEENAIGTNSSSGSIAGGDNNTIGNNSPNSFIGGGRYNSVHANSPFATVLGGSLNVAGAGYSLAAGHHAKAIHDGSFVWADSQNSDFGSTSANEFNIRAAGGFRLSIDTSMFFGASVRQMLNLYGTSYGIGVQTGTEYFRSSTHFAWYKGGVNHPAQFNPGFGGIELMRLLAEGGLHLSGPENELSLRNRDSVSTYVQTPANGERWVLYSRNEINSGRLYFWSGGDKASVDNTGNFYANSFTPTSDRNAKENFTPVDPEAVLDKVAALPITRWNFKQDTNTAHIGPMSQDFYVAFGVGPDDRHIATVDADGVALAAIQGLHRQLQEKTAAIEALQQRVERLERLLAATCDKPIR